MIDLPFGIICMLELLLRKMRYGEDYWDESEGKEGEDIGMICALLGGMREKPMFNVGI